MQGKQKPLSARLSWYRRTGTRWRCKIRHPMSGLWHTTLRPRRMDKGNWEGSKRELASKGSHNLRIALQSVGGGAAEGGLGVHGGYRLGVERRAVRPMSIPSVGGEQLEFPEQKQMLVLLLLSPQVLEMGAVMMK